MPWSQVSSPIAQDFALEVWWRGGGNGGDAARKLVPQYLHSLRELNLQSPALVHYDDLAAGLRMLFDELRKHVEIVLL